MFRKPSPTSPIAERRSALLESANHPSQKTVAGARRALQANDPADRWVAVAALGAMNESVETDLLTDMAAGAFPEHIAFAAAALLPYPPEIAGPVGMKLLHRLSLVVDPPFWQPVNGAEGRGGSFHAERALYLVDRLLREAYGLDPCTVKGHCFPAAALLQWNGALEPGFPEPRVRRFHARDESLAEVEWGRGRLRLEPSIRAHIEPDGAPVADFSVVEGFFIGGVQAFLSRVTCGTCPILLHSADDARVRAVSRAFSTLPARDLVHAPALDDLLGQFRTGTYRLRCLRPRFRPVAKDEKRLGFLFQNDLPSELLWVEPPEGAAEGPFVVARTIQARDSLDGATIAGYRARSPEARGSVVAYGYFDSRTWGPSGTSHELFVLVVLDGHHKLAAAVEAGEPCDVLAIIEQNTRGYYPELMELVAGQCAA